MTKRVRKAIEQLCMSNVAMDRKEQAVANFRAATAIQEKKCMHNYFLQLMAYA